MSAILGDSFPNNFKNHYAKQNLIPGNVMSCYLIDIGREKRFVIIGINSDNSLVAALIFNTNKPFVGNKVLESLQVHFKSHGKSYLEHDCYLNCAHIKIFSYKKLFDDLVSNPQHLLGEMSKNDLTEVCIVATNSRIISMKVVKRFGLTQYLLHT